jgi:hypothetical protein
MAFTNISNNVRKISEAFTILHKYLCCLGRLGEQINCDFVITQQKKNCDCQKLWNFRHTIKTMP